MSYTIEKLTGNMVPEQLREIPQPPRELYIAGKLPETTEGASAPIFLAVVGSRRYSDYGERCCRELILGLQGKSVAIISGLAYGIDVIAHRAALVAKLPTIAMPGSGLSPEVLYPRAHVNLAEEIIWAGGCMISEFPLNT